MSFTVSPTSPMSAIKDSPGVTLLPLPAMHSILIPAMGFASIPHGAELLLFRTPVLLVADKGALLPSCLIVQTAIMEEGELFTAVFNLSNQGYKVKAGQVLSHLISM